MKKILFVCLGNICRSPMAEAIFNHKVKEFGLETHLIGDSAGTANYHVGENPDPRTIETLEKKSIMIRRKGQQFKREHADEFDYLIAMDQSNKQNMLRELGNINQEVLLIRDFDPSGNGDVPDPWYGGMSGFDQVFDILDRSIDRLVDYIRKDLPS